MSTFTTTPYKTYTIVPGPTGPAGVSLTNNFTAIDADIHAVEQSVANADAKSIGGVVVDSTGKSDGRFLAFNLASNRIVYTVPPSPDLSIFPQRSGSTTAGRVAAWDASGNLIDAGATGSTSTLGGTSILMNDGSGSGGGNISMDGGGISYCSAFSMTDSGQTEQFSLSTFDPLTGNAGVQIGLGGLSLHFTTSGINLAGVPVYMNDGAGSGGGNFHLDGGNLQSVQSMEIQPLSQLGYNDITLLSVGNDDDYNYNGNSIQLIWSADHGRLEVGDQDGNKYQLACDLLSCSGLQNVYGGTLPIYSPISVSGNVSATNATIGYITRPSGWSGNGFLFNNGAGYYFSMVMAGGTAYFGAPDGNDVWWYVSTLSFIMNKPLNATAGLQIPSATPSSATALGVAGSVCYDTNYMYVCTAANTWRRTTLSSW